MNILLDDKAIKKIKLIDEFRERFSVEDNKKLTLPQIIVVGDQSSGKSSILEAISGIKLPRGVDTVTKCPIIIQLRKTNIERKRIKYLKLDFIEIEDTVKEIMKVQKTVFHDELTTEPITLLIESPRVVTLTIIDLPGLVKTKIIGQSDNMVKKTHEIAEFYMSQNNSLIICVLPANQDISTTSTIDIATKCNEDKSRIIGVMTKIDKLDCKEATLLPDILNNKKSYLNKGYYGLIVGDDFLQMNQDERHSFEIDKFKTIDLWKDGLKPRLGLKNFIDALVLELVTLIDKSLPVLMLNIDSFLIETNKELTTFSKYHGNTDLQYKYLLEIIGSIELKSKDILSEGGTEISKYYSMKNYFEENKYLTKIGQHDTFLYFWHKLFKDLYDSFNIIFKDFFSFKKSKYYDPQVLEKLIKSCRTENISIYASSKPFKIIVSEILDLFKMNTTYCINKFCEIIELIIENVFVMVIEDKLHLLKDDIKSTSREILHQQREELEKKIAFLFNSEGSYFSQDAIVEGYDKEVSTNIQETDIIPKMINSQSEANIPSVAFNQINPIKSNNFPLQPMQKAASDIKPEENNLYKNGKKLKENLDKYINNLIRRLGDIIPNFIRLSLFINFPSCLIETLHYKLHTTNLKLYFNITEDEEKDITNLEERKRSLEESKEQLKKLKVELAPKTNIKPL